ncbi:hypothetical protein ACHAW5_001820 [Stephanodiscus triporus]|uniref:Uncharacterized protein n=1 Tax=Stephanodiscus triporus TaxID=2934178 RepID=A0ABD3MMA9_9STRA
MGSQLLYGDEVDNNVVYGGELASASSPGRGGDGGLDQYVGLLVPILAVERDLNEIDALLRRKEKEEEEGGGGAAGNGSVGGGASSAGRGEGERASLLAEVNGVLSRSRFDKIEFKKAFNAFADNIYYSDPDRANLYLGGGAMPKNSQSIAYLLRNEILTNVEDMRAEVGYLMREAGKMTDNNNNGDAELDLDEMRRLSESANDGMKKYLDLVPPKELGAARAEFYASLPPPAS